MGKSKQSAGALLCDQVQDVASTVGPAVNEARANAREGLVNDVIPAVRESLDEVRSQLDDVRDQAVPLAEEARKRGLEAAAALRGGRRPRRGRKIVLGVGILALAAGGAFAAKKFLGSGSSSSPTGSSSPTPPPASGTAPGPAPSYAWGTSAASDTTGDATSEPPTSQTKADRADVLDAEGEADEDIMSPGSRTTGDRSDVLGPEGDGFK